MRRHAGIKNAAPATQPGRHFSFFCIHVAILHRCDIDFYKDIVQV
jgi:hypothetical protein